MNSANFDAANAKILRDAKLKRSRSISDAIGRLSARLRAFLKRDNAHGSQHV